MNIFPDIWEFASIVCKILLYAGAASIAGGSLCLWQFSDGSRRFNEHTFVYILLGSLLGFQAVLANFLIQVGLVNDRGFMGMFDWSMISLLLDTQQGDMAIYRLAAFVIVLLATILFLRKLSALNRPPSRQFYQTVMRVYTPALILLAYSFRIGGHVSVLGFSAQLGIFVHFLAFAFWIGSLYPLWTLTGSADLHFLKTTLERFGNTALFITAALAVAGLLMLLQLFASPGELIASAYGIAVSLKLVLVMLILGVAAVNRFILVPALVKGASTDNIARSIRWELILALLIMLLTSYLSTAIGPP